MPSRCADPRAARAGAREPGPSGALSDALKRKEQYLRQVATEGLAKLQSCLAQQSETLTETLCLRVWGDVVYWELARMRNHFLYRRAFVSGPWEDRRAGEGAAFENSKYIKTHLFTQIRGQGLAGADRVRPAQDQGPPPGLVVEGHG